MMAIKVRFESGVDSEVAREIAETYEVQFEDYSSLEFYVTKSFARCFSENHELVLCDCPRVEKVGSIRYVTYYYYCREHPDSRMYVIVTGGE